jgi:predicted HTH domain antitoxin
MKTLTLKIPESINITPKEASTALAARFYQTGKLSLGQAAELAGYSKKDFMKILANYGVSVFNYPASDLPRDVRNA